MDPDIHSGQDPLTCACGRHRGAARRPTDGQLFPADRRAVARLDPFSRRAMASPASRTGACRAGLSASIAMACGDVMRPASMTFTDPLQLMEPLGASHPRPYDGRSGCRSRGPESAVLTTGMIDAIYLKARRTASSLRLKTGGRRSKDRDHVRHAQGPAARCHPLRSLPQGPARRRHARGYRHVFAIKRERGLTLSG